MTGTGNSSQKQFILGGLVISTCLLQDFKQNVSFWKMKIKYLSFSPINAQGVVEIYLCLSRTMIYKSTAILINLNKNHRAKRDRWVLKFFSQIVCHI